MVLRGCSHASLGFRTVIWGYPRNSRQKSNTSWIVNISGIHFGIKSPKRGLSTRPRDVHVNRDWWSEPSFLLKNARFYDFSALFWPQGSPSGARMHFGRKSANRGLSTSLYWRVLEGSSVAEKTELRTKMGGPNVRFERLFVIFLIWCWTSVADCGPFYCGH